MFAAASKALSLGMGEHSAFARSLVCAGANDSADLRDRLRMVVAALAGVTQALDVG